MNDMSQDARSDEEQSTQRRARILGMNYVDTSRMPNKPIYKAVLPFADITTMRVVPVQADQSTVLFGVTTTTSQATMHALSQRFSDQRVSFAIMSDTGFHEYLNLYNPPKKIIYQ